MAIEVADIINQALRAGGVPLRIAEPYDGSEASKVALELYSQCRDELLRDKDWSFSRRVAYLSLLKGPPPNGGYSFATPWSAAYPMPGFLYEYGYPTDCLDLRAIIAPPGLMPDADPLPALWRVDNDPTPNVGGQYSVPSGPPAKVILCNTTDAIAIYRGRITDPTLFEPGFIAALVASLGKKFAKAFGADANTTKEETGEAVSTVQAASEIRG